MSDTINPLRKNRIDDPLFNANDVAPIKPTTVEKEQPAAIQKKQVVQDYSHQRQEQHSATQKPLLKEPVKNIGVKTALDPKQQRVVKFDFKRKASEQLQSYKLPPHQFDQTLQSIVNPDKKLELAPDLAKIAKKVTLDTTQVIQERYKLNHDWAINTQTAKNWTPERSPSLERTVQYNAAQQHQINTQFQDLLKQNTELYIQTIEGPHRAEIITGLREGLRTGEPSDSSRSHCEAVESETLETVRQEHLLPITWVPFSEKAADWKALPAGSIDPILSNKLQLHSLTQNIENHFKEVSEISNRLANRSDATDDDKIKNKDNQQSVFDVLREVAMAVNLMQLEDVKSTYKTAQDRAKLIEDTRKLQETMEKENLANQVEQNSQQNIINIVKYVAIGLGVLLSAVVILGIAIVTAPSTGGTSVIAAAMAISVVKQAAVAAVGVGVGYGFAILDQYTGITAKIIDGLGSVSDKIVEEIFGINCPKVIKDIVKYALAIAIIVFIIVVAIVITLVAKHVSSTIASEIVKKIADLIGAGANVAWSSANQALGSVAFGGVVQIISSMARPFLEFCGLNTDQIDKIMIVITATVTALLLVISIIATLKKGGSAGGGGKALSGGIGGLRGLLNPEIISGLVKSAADIAENSINAASQIGLAEFEKNKGALEAVIALTDNLGNLLQKASGKQNKELETQQEWVASFSQMLNQMVDNASFSINQLINSV